jgi:hypothetical protein
MNRARELAEEVVAERNRQDEKWGVQDHPDGTGGKVDKLRADNARVDCDDAFKAGRGTYRDILAEEVAEAFAESDPVALRAELVQVAAVALAWVEAIDRRTPVRAVEVWMAPLADGQGGGI